MTFQVPYRLQDFLKSFGRAPTAEFQLDTAFRFRAVESERHEGDVVTLPWQTPADCLPLN